MSNVPNFVYFNGLYLPEEEALIPAGARAVGYGEGVFDSLVIEDNYIFFAEKHLKRFNRGCKMLASNTSELDFNTFIHIVKTLAKKNSWYNGNARIRIQAGVLNQAGRWVTGKHLFLLITIIPFQPVNKSVRLTFSRYTKNPVGTLPFGFKWSQYLQNMLVLEEAKTLNFDDAVVLTTDGSVSETAISNIFWVKKNEIFTPAESTGLLPGIMRQIIIELSEKIGLKLNIGHFSKSEFLLADSVFVTNSVKRLQIVECINSDNLETNHSLVTRLKDSLSHYIRENRYKLYNE